MSVDKAEVLGAIAKQLAAAGASDRPFGDIRLLGGDFGDACFLMHYAEVDKGYHPVAEALLEKAIASLNRFSHIGTYCNGLAGFAYGLLQLEKLGFVDGASSALESIDMRVRDCLDHALRYHNIDFLHGAIGYGFYMVERYDTAPAYAIPAISTIIEHLDNTKIASVKGIYWEYSSDDDGERKNISLSHGISSIILLLSRIIVKGILDGLKIKDSAEELLRSSVDFLLSQRLDNETLPNLYPSTSKEASAAYCYSRLAWCYGDLGIALALENAANAIGDSEWLNESLAIVERASKRRDVQSTSVYDACVCHGASGVALMFNHFAPIFDSQSLRDAASFWDEMILKFYTPDALRCFMCFNSAKGQWECRAGILEGLGGIGFALLDDKRFINRALLIE